MDCVTDTAPEIRLLTFALVGPFAITLHGYQGRQDEPFSMVSEFTPGLALGR